MRNCFLKSGLILVALCVPSKILAQDVEEEVRKAAEAAVASAVSQAISDTVVSGIPAAAGITPSSVAWTRPSFTFLDVDGSDSEFFVLPAGVVHRLNERVLLNANVQAGHASTDGGSADFDPSDPPFQQQALVTSIDESSTDIDDSTEFAGAGVGVTYVAHRDESSAAWFSLSGLYNHTFIENMEDRDTLTLTPSATYSTIVDPVIVEPSVSLPVSFDLTENAQDEVTPSIRGGLRISRREGPIVPEVNVSINRTLEDDAEGVTLRVTPEVNYQMDNYKIGVGYSYSTDVGNDDFDTEGHTVILNFNMKL